LAGSAFYQMRPREMYYTFQTMLYQLHTFV